MSSTSIFFESATSFVILKVRIWPSASGSGAAVGEGTLPFQRAFSMEESCERSGAAELAGPAGLAAFAGLAELAVLAGTNAGMRRECLRRVQLLRRKR